MLGVLTAVADFSVRLYPPTWRWVAALLVIVSRASLAVLLVVVVLANDPPIGLFALIQLLILFSAAPAGAALLIRRSREARLELYDADLVVRRNNLLMEVPRGAIVRIVAWALPLPGAGLVLWLRSGRRLRDALEADDPAALLDALAGGGDRRPAPTLHPTVAYAHAAASRAAWRWYHYLWKFVLFALAPTAVLFNAHQHIAYGGTLGEYYLLGPAAYLQTFALYWIAVAVHLVLFAGLWRVVAETTAWLATWAAPSRAARVRRIAELGCAVLYYAGVPALLALRFLI